MAAVAAGVVDAAGGKHVGIGADMLSTHHLRQLLQHACGHGVEVSHGAQ
ncbi:putative D-lactate dehydrogenase domain protein [Mycobacterium xenopi 3993]|nr:putative D-lactate dehydrogenase domain protein [Mycobacterium xenopi 3993]